MSWKPSSWKTLTVLAVAAMVVATGVNAIGYSAQITVSQNSTSTPQQPSKSQPQQQLIRTITGASEQLTAIAVSPDGQLLASAGRDKTIQLWNPNTGKLLNTLNGHSDAVTAVAISRNGQLLASASDDKTIKLWNLQTGQLVRTLKGHSDGVTSLAITPDGRLASGSKDKTIKLWNLQTGQLVRTLNGKAGAVLSLAISPDGQMLASGSGDNNWPALAENSAVQLWDLKTGKLIPTLFEKQRYLFPVNAVAFSPDGQSIASAAILDISKGHIEGNTVNIHDIKTGKLIYSFSPGAHESVKSLLFSPDGQTLITGLGDVSLWNAKSGEILRNLQIGSKAAILSADGQTLISGSEGKITLWRIDTLISQSWQNERLSRTLSLPSAKGWGFAAVAISPDGERIVSTGYNQIQVWNQKTGELLYSLDAEWVTPIAMSPDGQTLASTSRRVENDKIQWKVKLWDLKTGRLKGTLVEHQDEIDDLAFSADGQTVASSSLDGRINVWNLGGGCVSGNPCAPSYTISENLSRGARYSVAISPDGQTLVSGRYQDGLKLWDLKTGNLLRTLDVQAAGAIAVSPNGKTLIGTGPKGSVKVWSLQTGEVLRTLPSESDRNPGLAFNSPGAFAVSPSGQVLASDSESGTIELWNLQTGELLDTLRGHSSQISSLAFSADGQTLVSSGEEGLVKIWQVPSP